MFSLPDLPYAYDALEPVISERAMRLHHDHHHAAYVEKTNALLADGGSKAAPTLEDVIRDARGAGDRSLFNNAAQAWNHGFFWASMTPDRGAPSGDLAEAIEAAFGDLAALRQRFVDEGAAHFGSGWLWLIADRAGELRVRSTHDADDMVTEPGLTPLIACDLWEHAYYIDHQYDRPAYLEAWFDALPNWSFAARQHAARADLGNVWRYPVAEAAPRPVRRAG